MRSNPPPRRHNHEGYLAEDTILAVATALGGAVAIVRVSGPATRAAVAALVPSLREAPEPRKLVRARLSERSGAPIDDALVAFFAAPNSYTGEDCAEFQIHGGAFVAQRLIEALRAEGLRPALPGEFSFRAVRNGKMSITEAQAVADLIGATNDAAATLALEKMSGTQNRLIRDLAESLRTLAMLGEVGIDFSDQDVDEVSLPTLKRRAGSVLETLERLRASYQRGSRIQDGVGVAFVGLPNAGKSSLFNALLGEDRSIVSEIAGTTRDVVRERLTLTGTSGSVTLRLSDTAGLRDADDQVERMGVERTVQVASEADLILVVADASRIQESLEVLSVQWKRLGAPREKAIGILTKCDLASDAAQAFGEASLMALGLSQVHRTSAKDGAGVQEAAQGIADFCSSWVRRDRGEVVLTRYDHLAAVEGAIEQLTRALGAQEIDLFASDVRHALNALSPLIGETLPDDILGQIFSSFCIGK